MSVTGWRLSHLAPHRAWKGVARRACALQSEAALLFSSSSGGGGGRRGRVGRVRIPLKVRPVLRRYTLSNTKLPASMTPRAIAEVGAVEIMW